MFQYYFVLDGFCIPWLWQHFYQVNQETFYCDNWRSIFSFCIHDEWNNVHVFCLGLWPLQSHFFIFAVVAPIVGYCLTILFEKCFECMLLLLMTIIIPDVITNKVLTLRVYQGWSVLNNVEVQELVWLFFISSLKILRIILFIWHFRVKLVLLKRKLYSSKCCKQSAAYRIHGDEWITNL